MNKNAAVIGIVVVLGIGAWALVANSPMPQADNSGTGNNTVSAPPAAPSQNNNPSPERVTATPSPQVNQPANQKEFTVTGQNFSFTPSTLAVKKGDTVKITFKNVDGFHDFKIDEFAVATQRIGTGQEENVEFVADKTGTFEYYCSVANHRAMGMKGTLTVTE